MLILPALISPGYAGRHGPDETRGKRRPTVRGNTLTASATEDTKTVAPTATCIVSFDGSRGRSGFRCFCAWLSGGSRRSVILLAGLVPRFRGRVLSFCLFGRELPGRVPGLGGFHDLAVLKALRYPDCRVPQHFELRRVVGAPRRMVRGRVRGVAAVTVPGVQLAHWPSRADIGVPTLDTDHWAGMVQTGGCHPAASMLASRLAARSSNLPRWLDLGPWRLEDRIPSGGRPGGGIPGRGEWSRGEAPGINSLFSDIE